MFGYIACIKSELSKEEQDRYQSLYCGLCRCLKHRYGELERLSLTYDMTFLILFLSSLYEPDETSEEFRCSVHPLSKKVSIENKYTEYAADMTVALSYFKAIDDWKDEKKRYMQWYGGYLEKAYKLVAVRYPRQCSSISESIAEMNALEQMKGANPDQVLNCAGKMLSEVFVYEEDFWSNSLRTFGYEIGRFIYLMDAAIDYSKDIKKNNYNPLLDMGKRPEDIEPMLKIPLGNVANIFEKLPLVQDDNLIRNILYGGVWQQYYAKVKGKDKGREKEKAQANG